MVIAIAVALLSPSLQKPPVLDIPQDPWVDLFFNPATDTQAINGRAKLSGLQDLQKKSQPAGVTEVRLWEGFGVTYLEGYRFRFDGKSWRGWWLQPAREDRPAWKANNYVVELKAPKQGWQAFWKGLMSNDLPTLPDFESLPGPKATILDGVCYVVEHTSGGKYRTYMYNNPNSQRSTWPELTKLKAIVKSVHDSFRDQTIR